MIAITSLAESPLRRLAHFTLDTVSGETEWRSSSMSTRTAQNSVNDKLAELGPQGLITTLKQLADGTAKPEVQDETLVTYAEKLSKEEARIDWSLSAAQLERCIRAFNPWPMSWLEIEGQPVKV